MAMERGKAAERRFPKEADIQGNSPRAPRAPKGCVVLFFTLPNQKLGFERGGKERGKKGGEGSDTARNSFGLCAARALACARKHREMPCARALRVCMRCARACVAILLRRVASHAVVFGFVLDKGTAHSPRALLWWGQPRGLGPLHGGGERGWDGRSAI
jgi:hypothetical protein